MKQSKQQLSKISTEKVRLELTQTCKCLCRAAPTAHGSAYAVHQDCPLFQHLHVHSTGQESKGEQPGPSARPPITAVSKPECTLFRAFSSEAK